MRKFTILLALLAFLGVQAVQAQQTITGTVTSAEDGSPVPGVQVVVKGTTQGTTTDLDGNYEITVEDEAETLVFKFVGMVTKEVPIANKTVINVTMEPEVKDIEGVVVTALGVSREKKSLGYAVQEVSSEDIEKTNQTNVINSLSGKAAGVNVSTSTGSFGGSSRILLRGVHSIDGNNNPLFVVDGVPMNNQNFNSYTTERGAGGVDWGNAALDINPSDIKTVSVLKGPSATALYGSRGANGVIMIETKRGEEQEGIGVTWSSNVTFSEVGKLPEYQNKYGGGNGPFGTVTVDGEEYRTAYYAMDQSWGPRFEGQEVVQWNNVYDWEQGITENLQTRPWEANEGNIRNFFETGLSLKNNIAFSGGDENHTFRLSYTNTNRTGVFPNSGLQKNNISFNGSSNLTDDFEVHANINYLNYHNKARPATGYSDYSHMQKFTQWGQRQFDFGLMKNYLNPDGTQRTWNRKSFTDPAPKYADNPYFIQHEAYPEQWRERVYGKIGFNYSITDKLKFTGNVKKDFYTDTRENRIPEGSVNISEFERDIYEVTEDNYELQLRYNTDLSEQISMNGLVGANRYDYSYKNNYAATQGGLSVPGLFATDNAKSTPTTSDAMREKRINSLYGRLGFSYKSLVFLDMTLRNDWSSALPEGNNSYMYPSVTGSFVFSDLDALQDYEWLSFAKIRGSWAQVGNDTDPYQTSLTYATYDSFDGSPRISIPNTLNNPELKPETTESIEGGLNLVFFNDRLGFDFTYYTESSYDQILTLPVTASSGYSSKIVNAGEIENSGIEIMMNVTPIESNDFSWDINVNWSQNDNQVVELAEGITNYQLASGPFNVTVSAAEGEPYGVISGSGYQYDDNGNKIVAGGMYAGTDAPINLGTYLPDWTGGLTNSFNYKGLDFSFTIDVRSGGSLFSTTKMWGTYSGMLEETAENNIREYGMVLEGVKPDGSPNDVAIHPQIKGLNHYFLDEMNIIETDYFKLRSVNLSYTLPANMFNSVPIQGLTVGITGRNLFMWGTDSKHFDPEHTTTSGNIQGIEGGGVPPTRAYGFKLDVKL
ncbi:MAG: SusC/RagA family TonB-linked outer membrane protein [Bacteroidales bacterium]|nr:SusC/RagA family TonB-linked outer membrane protein [Bacteroidales bacterium]